MSFPNFKFSSFVTVPIRGTVVNFAVCDFYF